MRTIFTDNIRYSMMCCTKALMCVVRLDGHIDKLFFVDSLLRKVMLVLGIKFKAFQAALIALVSRAAGKIKVVCRQHV